MITTALHHLLILGAIFTTAITSTKEVILREVGDHSGCPGDIRTFNCSVNNQYSALEWCCAKNVHRIIDCKTNDSAAIPISCYDQTLTPKSHECKSTSDGTIITSSVRINVSSYTTTWSCVNPANPSQNESVTVTVKVPPPVTLILSGTRNTADDKVQVANITWQKTTSIPYHNQTYNVTVEPAAIQGCNSSCVTANQSIELMLATGTEYTVAVVSEICNGKLKSAKSKPLPIHLKGPSGSSIKVLVIWIVSTLLTLLLISLLLYILQPLLLTLCHWMNICWKKKVKKYWRQAILRFWKRQLKTYLTPGPIEAGRSVIHTGTIYFAAYKSNQIQCYSVSEKKWHDYGRPMFYCNPGLAIICDCVTAIGGQKKNKPTDEVWAWNESKWERYPCLKMKRSDPAVVSSADRMYIVVCGGNIHNGYAVHWTGTVEVYTVEKKQWEVVCELPLSYRTRLEATLCNDIVYVFTDRNTKGATCTLNALLSSAGVVDWRQIQGPPEDFSTPATLKNNVVCIGGADEKGCGVPHVYVYNGKAWDKIGYVQGEGRMYCMVEVLNTECIVVGGISKITDGRDPSARLKRVDFFPSDDKKES